MTTFFKSATLIVLMMMMQGCLDLFDVSGGGSRPGGGGGASSSSNLESGEDDPDSGNSAFQRPDNAIFFQNNFCACLNGQVDMLGGNCDNFCASNNSGNSILHINMTIGPEIELNEIFNTTASSGSQGNVQGWCSNDISSLTGGVPVNPSCVVEFFDESGNIIPLTPIINGTNNSLTVDISTLDYGKPYTVTLKEITSNASSATPIQVYRKLFSDPTPPPALLSLMPVHLYHCLNNATDPNNPNNVLATAKQHFVFPSNDAPPSVVSNTPAGQIPPIFCHDIYQFGYLDFPSFPRLGLKESHFTLWNSADPRMADLNNNSIIDINEEIIQAIQDPPYNISNPNTNATFFTPFFWQDGPTLPASGGTPIIGFGLLPFVQGTDVFCPTSAEYNRWDSNNPNIDDAIFNVLGNYIGADTEAIYLALKDPEYFTNSNGIVTPFPDDLLLIRRSELEDHAFYINSSNIAIPAVSQEDYNTKQIYFYYPLCQNPQATNCNLIQAGRQRYSIVDPQTAFSPGSQTTVNTTISAMDKRLYCIPKQ